MSSVPASEVLRSLSFRRWLPLALVLALVHTATLWWLTGTARELIWQQWTEKVGEALDELIFDSWEIGTLGPMMAVEVESAALEELDEEDEEDVSPRAIRQALRIYVTEVRDRLREPDLPPDERLGLRLRLALVGEETAQLLVGRPVDAFLEHLLDELPDPVHDTVIERVERLAGFDEGELLEGEFEDETPGLSGLSVATLARILDEEEWLVEAEGTCLEVRSVDGKVAMANLDTVSDDTGGRDIDAGDGLFFWPVAFTHRERGDARSEYRHCLAAEVPLADGVVRFGLDVTEPREQLRTITVARNALAAGGVVLAVLISFFAARNRVRHLAAIRDVRRRLTDGDSRARLETGGLGGDLGLATAEINSILDQLEQSVGSLSHVVDNIAHDLRSPLTRMQGQLDILKRSPQANEAMVAAVQEEADQLLLTFNALLRIAQVESGSRRHGFRRFDLGRVVADVGELYEPAFADKDLAFQCRLPRQPVHQIGDSDLWMQALSNLLDNALKYTPEGGEVDLQLTAIGGGARIVLRDSGPGIPEHERENVFRRFYRLARQQHQRGSGLGLSLVSAVCDLHDAGITLDQDGGLRVTIDLPRARRQSAPSH